jgi:hypothetical protein
MMYVPSTVGSVCEVRSVLVSVRTMLTETAQSKCRRDRRVDDLVVSKL